MSTVKKFNKETGSAHKRWKQVYEETNEMKQATPSGQAAPQPFTVNFQGGAIIIDGPYDPDKFYRLAVLSDNGNPIQDINPEWGGWPFVWSAENFPDNPPPTGPLFWTLSEENYISRRWRNRRQYPVDYRRTTWEGVCK